MDTPGVKSRLLDPFFSTKFLGRGLGLPSAHGIIMQHEGRLDVESQEGSGTTVTVILPLAEYRRR
jgi:two-component system cell cycle sensor histidine kinase/response regulator CckA